MDRDLADRMETRRKQLQTRSLELSHPGQDHDKAAIFISLALIFEALLDMDREQQRLTARQFHQ